MDDLRKRQAACVYEVVGAVGYDADSFHRRRQFLVAVPLCLVQLGTKSGLGGACATAFDEHSADK